MNIFAGRHARPHLPRIVKAHEDGIQIFLVVAEISFGGLRNRLAIVGIALGESGDLGHLQGNFSLRLHGQKIFQGWRALQPRDGQRGRSELCWSGALRGGILRRKAGAADGDLRQQEEQQSCMLKKFHPNRTRTRLRPHSPSLIPIAARGGTQHDTPPAASTERENAVCLVCRTRRMGAGGPKSRGVRTTTPACGSA